MLHIFVQPFSSIKHVEMIKCRYRKSYSLINGEYYDLSKQPLSNHPNDNLDITLFLESQINM